VVVDRIGALVDLTFPPNSSGNLGPVQLSPAFKFPTGIGMSVDSGAISGGGFLYIDQPNGRYGGAVELSIYQIAVKAFGLIETRVPGVDFSFVILISAEFPPVQLGFGFTLNGVGGIIGINRRVDAKALAEKVASGALDHVLFPHNVTENAPAIIADLQAIFPAAADRYLFGPLAKIGWGTPTLVEAQLGIILELPNPILTILGTLRARLPKVKDGDTALVILNMDVVGRLDFPKKHFELDAQLRDSTAGRYVISGQMAMRLDWGNRPNFAISVGGFNTAFTPPPGFPPLRRMAIELGLKDNPSVALTGYFALTSNTAQVGAKLEAWVSKYGATLTGNLGFDAIIVFSPFSFEARLYGGVHVDFLGCGFTLTFEGTLSGPSPWRIHGHVCVGVWFAEACVGFNETLGSESKPTLPSLDPWFGSPVGALLVDQEVGGLRPAIEDLRNWEGVLPAGAFTGVTYIERKPAVLRVDPVGVATFRQKSVPLNYDITRFAGTTPSRTGEIKVTTVTVGSGTPATATMVKDYFAPAQYRQMPEAEQLSSEAFEYLDAGAAIESRKVTNGAIQAETIQYRTFTIDADGNVDEPGIQHTPTTAQLEGMSTASSASRPAIRLTGASRFTDRRLPVKLTDDLPVFGVAFRGTLGAVPNLATGITRSQANALLAGAAGSVAANRRALQITPSFLLAA
jgi:hypothetical protein